MIKKALICFGLFIIGWMSVGMQNPNSLENNTNSNYYFERQAWVDSVYNTMTIEEKIGQFFMIPVHPEGGNEVKQAYLKSIKESKVGGLIYFKSNPTRIANWTNEFQDSADIPLFIAIDGEWGVNMRLDSTVKWPKQLTLGALQDENLIYKMGEAIGNECKTLGININFAPVVDVNNNPNNPVINYRSFGEDKYNVALKGIAYAQGMQDVGVMAVAKHFPGHGDTDKDSHKTLPVINHNLSRLHDVELYPFKALINEGVQGIMAAHLFIPALDSTPKQATSLSRKVVTHLLKDSLGFNGLVFSDALNMKGVSEYNNPAEVYYQSFKAGNDVLVYTQYTPDGISRIKKAVYEGDISELELKERLKNLLNCKYDITQGKKHYADTVNLIDKLNPTSAYQLLGSLYAKAITLVTDNNKLLPISEHHKNIATISLGASGIQHWQKNLEAYYPLDNYNNGALSSMYEKLKTKDLVVVGFHGMSWWASKRYGISANQVDFISQLSKETNVVVVLFGSPYAVKYFDDKVTLLVANEDNIYTQNGVINSLAGTQAITGKLPVSSGIFKAGEGIEQTKTRDVLMFASPEEVGMHSNSLNQINTYLKRIIETEASPGGQVLVAKKGKVIFNEPFGFQTYENRIPVKVNHLYDIASITKIAATTISIIKLVNDGLLDLDKTVADYLPEYKTAKVADVVIRDVLVHQSGLPGWIPFYLSTIDDSLYSIFYCTEDEKGICYKVADSLFMYKNMDSIIWNDIKEANVKENPEYRYSDIGFYLLYKIIEELTETYLDAYVQETFYKPMGIRNLTYNPLNKFHRNYIIPTENDTLFRKQLVRGYVHDPGAAMLGGVCGHAGLFSNAFDLAALMQMLLNNGFYNNKKLLDGDLIDEFTKQQIEDNRRGLGFDKPVLERDNTGPTCAQASLETFGHTGFTGTAVWADPKYDLIYVFLSNRVYPDANNWTLLKENFRTDIQEIIYQSLIEYNDTVEFLIN